MCNLKKKSYHLTQLHLSRHISKFTNIYRHVCLIPYSPLEACNREKNIAGKILVSVLRADGPTNLTPMKNLQSPDEKSASELRA